MAVWADLSSMLTYFRGTICVHPLYFLDAYVLLGNGMKPWLLLCVLLHWTLHLCMVMWQIHHLRTFRLHSWYIPDSKVHEAYMGPTWADRTQVGPMLALWTLLSGMYPTYCAFWLIIQWFCLPIVPMHTHNIDSNYHATVPFCVNSIQLK